MRILAVETSCDETAAAVIVRDDDADFATIETSIVASQAKLHQKYGGVYPEVASREHIKQILPVIAEALGLEPHYDRLPDFAAKQINYLAVTHGPGLIGSLLVGTQTMASLAMATGTPLLPVNHLAGHIYASFIRQGDAWQAPKFPLLALIASGGHTLLIRMNKHYDFELLGQTRDDAIGEAFDKVAKLLELPYPGGPQIGKLATKGNREAFDFPIGLAKEDTLDFSFSGLKTAVLRQVQALPEPISMHDKADIAASFEKAAIEALLLRIGQSLKQYPVHDFILGGGVAANSYLRERLATFLAYHSPPVTLHVPPLELCTDNAAVIGAAAAFGARKPVLPTQLETFARLPLTKH